MKLYEYVYGLFNYFDFSFIEGVYPINIGTDIYNLHSYEVFKLSEHDFILFDELTEFYRVIEKKCERFSNSIPCSKSLLIYNNYFEKYLKKYTESNKSLGKKIKCLAERAICIAVQIDHTTNDNPMEYINVTRDIDGIEKARQIFLSVLREFYNYHIWIRSPHIDIPDISLNNMNGMFSFFSDDKHDLITKTLPIQSFWTPRFEENAENKARIFFQNSDSIPIEDLTMAKAQAYAECQQFSLSIIHAVISLEVIVPAFINKFLKNRGVNEKAIKDFNHKFGLSVRVKAFLKVIFPQTLHKIIDDVSGVITIRNKILHEGLHDPSFTDTQVKNLIEACMKLKKEIKEYSVENNF